jgi:hypothetical protein
MAIQVSGTEVISNSRVLSNVTGLKTVNSTSLLGSGDIAAGASTTYGAVGTYVIGSQFVAPNSDGTTENTTVAGSALLPGGWGMNEISLSDDAQKSAEVTKGGSALSGTWRAMGRANHNYVGTGAATGRWTLFVRTV